VSRQDLVGFRWTGRVQIDPLLTTRLGRRVWAALRTAVGLGVLGGDTLTMGHTKAGIRLPGQSRLAAMSGGTPYQWSHL